MKLTVTQLKRIIKEEMQIAEKTDGYEAAARAATNSGGTNASRVAAVIATGIKAWTNPKSRGQVEGWTYDGAAAYYDALVAFARARDKVLTAEQVLEDDKREEIRADIERIVNQFISKNKLK